MRGGCWDASAFAEEVQAVLRDWRKGLLTDREALEAVLEAAYANNFGDGLEDGGEDE
ncbi:hypothetical protein TthTF19_14340 [Thermus thermophilus]|uniref:hypothetical protein n=1 Tax=Thermus TaxID=270 RepID=UPI0011640F8F|nr:MULTISPECIES: hypothetical protein [Thermus]ULR41777.1 hypothetical protein MI302_05840 [Thermus sp. NEB1569]BBL93139.1 hypothetical protein TthHC11_06730 [Thermus thermophilus]